MVLAGLEASMGLRIPPGVVLLGGDWLSGNKNKRPRWIGNLPTHGIEHISCFFFSPYFARTLVACRLLAYLLCVFPTTRSI